jgi:hypothetical protein
MASSAREEECYGRQRSENYDRDHDVAQLEIKFESLKEMSLFSAGIPEDDYIEYHDVEVGQDAWRNWWSL